MVTRSKGTTAGEGERWEHNAGSGEHAGTRQPVTAHTLVKGLSFQSRASLQKAAHPLRMLPALS